MRKTGLTFLMLLTLFCTAKAQSVSVNADSTITNDMIRKSLRQGTVHTASGEYSRWGFSLNFADILFCGTLNAGAQFSVARRVSLDANVRYNNWTYNDDTPADRFRYAQRTVAAGIRFWPWYVYSGWWIGTKAQYQEYSRGGLFNMKYKEEGDAFGLALSGGYAVQINPWLDIDFGLGFWGGVKNSTTWFLEDESCPKCGRQIDKGTRLFLLPNEVFVSLLFVF